MATPIRVLIVEDSEDDTELIVRQLRQAGYDPAWQQIDTLQAFAAALTQPYDVILCDYRLPQFTGMDALQLLRESGVHIPLILISGFLGEEQAVECIKQGASDYLLKDRLARLGTAVERAIAEATSRRTQREMQEALRQSEAHYRTLVDSPFALICRWLPNGVLTYTNQTYATVFGKRPEELAGEHWASLLLIPERDAIEAVYRERLADMQPVAIEHPIVDANGRQRMILWTDYPIFDAEGNVVEFQSIGQDVTQLRQVEQQIQLLSRAVEQSPVAIIVTDRSGAIIYVNPHAEEATGFTQAEMLGRNPSILKSGNTPPEVYRDLWNTVLSGQRWYGELENRKKNGDLVWAAIRISPILDTEGQITHLVAVQEDITERKATEAELRRLNDQLELRVEERTAELRTVNAALERAARAKDEFLASMSHELRTPLSAILGVSEAFEEAIYGPVSERQKRALQTIRTSGEHLLGLISDILDVAKSEAGLLQPTFELVSVDDVCQTSLNLVRGLAQKKNLRVGFSQQPAGIAMLADARRLKQILVNLLSNAVKFTPDGGRIGLEVAADPQQAILQFTVWDTGIGIAEQNLPRLFQPFTQLDASLAREYNGTGLGLALVRTMAEMHDGSVAVQSKLGEGSRFTVSLPWRQPDELSHASDRDLPAVPPVPNRDLVPGRKPLILLTDDNNTILEVYSSYLEASGCEVVTAYRGSDAVRIAEDRHPALILMDIQMPGMDGLATIRHLRASRDPEVAAIPIVAVTALAMQGDRERCLEAGANAYLSKPVSLVQLAQMIAHLVPQFAS